MKDSKTNTLIKGQKLTIKQYTTKPKHWVPDMLKYMNSEVTFKEVRVNGSISIAEDQGEVLGGWHWKLCNFIGF